MDPISGLAVAIIVGTIGTKIIDWVAYMFLKPQTQQTTDVGTAMASVMSAIMPLMFMMMFMNMMMSMVQMPMVAFRR